MTRITVSRCLARYHVRRLAAADGWDLTSECIEPKTAQALTLAGGDAGIVDNRLSFVGVDDADTRQPYYRIQLREGRGHYAAQENLTAVPHDESFRLPIRGTSFFFVKAHAGSGCLVPRHELAQRYPEDVEAMLLMCSG